MAANNRVYVSYAAEDKYARDFLVGQAAKHGSSFEFVDLEDKHAFDLTWKTRCKTVMKHCDGVIVLLSTHTEHSTPARWEVWCAKDHKMPVLGVHVSKENKAPTLPELAGAPIIDWTWTNLSQFLSSL